MKNFVVYVVQTLVYRESDIELIESSQLQDLDTLSKDERFNKVESPERYGGLISSKTSYFTPCILGKNLLKKLILNKEEKVHV
jgi:hypothetical protein